MSHDDENSEQFITSLRAQLERRNRRAFYRAFIILSVSVAIVVSLLIVALLTSCNSVPPEAVARFQKWTLTPVYLMPTGHTLQAFVTDTPVPTVTPLPVSTPIFTPERPACIVRLDTLPEEISYLNLRLCPGITCPVIAWVPGGARLSIFEQKQNWLLVAYDQSTGWVNSRYCEKEP